MRNQPIGAVMLLLLLSCSVGGAWAPGEDEEITIDQETLANKRFEFSWSSAEGGGVNDIATLRENGAIEGIASPNETAWLVDASGRLIFKHADGRVSTRFEKVCRIEGFLYFEGPFLLREGITHHLVEIEGAAAAGENGRTPAQSAEIAYSTQRFVYLAVGEACMFRLKDGTRANGPVAEKVYEKPGCYMASLWIADGHGERDVDFCTVRVYSRSAPEEVVPTIFVTHLPAADVSVGQPVYFRIWPQGLALENLTVDFGDGTTVTHYRPYAAITHAFREAGIRIVTVTGAARGLPVTQKVKVRVLK